MTKEFGSLRIVLATAGLGCAWGCGNTDMLTTDDASNPGLRGGRVAHAVSAVEAERAETAVRESMFDFVATTHGFRAAGMSDEDIQDVVSYIRDAQTGGDVIDIGRPTLETPNPGIETFNVSCALCHGSPDSLGNTQQTPGAVVAQDWYAIGP